MKGLVTLLFLTFCSGYISAQNLIQVHATYNLPLYHKYNKGTEDFRSQGAQVESHVLSMGIDCQLFEINRFSMRAGISYKYQDVRVKDVFTSYTYWYHTKYSAYQNTHYYEDPPDYVAKSHDFGALLESHYRTFQTPTFRGDAGLRFQIFFYEFYNEDYVTSDEGLSIPINGHEVMIPSPNFHKRTDRFVVSAAELSAFYQINVLAGEKFSTGIRAEVGTNLYSQWNSFRSYVWCGLGLHFGFGKTKYRMMNEIQR